MPVAIERQFECLANPGVLAQRILLRHIALADVDGDALVADLGDRGDLESAVRLDRRDVGGRHALDEVELSGFEVGEAHRRVDDRRVDDSFEEDAALVPVVRIALDHDLVLRDALDEAERSRAHRLVAELVARLLRGLGRDHHSGAVGELREQRSERRRQIQADRHRIDHVDACHRRQLAAAVRSGHRLVALDVVFHRGGVELLAVVEGDARSHLDGQRLVVRGPFVAGGELRHDVELFVDVEELVAQRREHDAADEGARQRGIEHVGILGEPEAQRLRARAGGGCREQHRREMEQAIDPGSGLHECSPEDRRWAGCGYAVAQPVDLSEFPGCARHCVSGGALRETGGSLVRSGVEALDFHLDLRAIGEPRGARPRRQAGDKRLVALEALHVEAQQLS